MFFWFIIWWFRVGNTVRFNAWWITWKNNWNLLYLFDIDRDLDAGVIKSVGWTIGRYVGSVLVRDIGSYFESVDDVEVRVLVWAKVGYSYGRIHSNEIKDGVNVIFNDSVGWYVSRGVGAEVCRYVDSEVNDSMMEYVWMLMPV